MSGSWQTVKIADLGRVVTGRTPSGKSPEHFGSDYPFVTPKDIGNDNRHIETERFVSELGRQKLERILLPKGSICFVCIGATIGKICVTSRPSFTNQQINSVVVDETKHDPRFIFYLLSREGENAKGLAGGAATPIINKGNFELMEVDVPDLPTQRRIAGILSAYDDLIENNLRRIRILEEMAQSLYREWFVHFRIPSEVLLAASEASGEGGQKAGLPPEITLVDSPLGPIPDGWEAGRLDDIVFLQRGFDITRKQQVAGPYPVVSSSGPSSTHSEFKVSGPGIVIGRKGALGTVHLVESDFWPHDTTLWVKEFRKGSALNAFYLLRELDLKRFDTGAAVPTLNRNNVHCLPIPVPPEPLLQRFESFAQSVHEEANLLRRKNQTLRQTRDLLLPKLLTS
jgi:type I restriction enzyme S subunit